LEGLYRLRMILVLWSVMLGVGLWYVASLTFDRVRLTFLGFDFV